MQQQLKPKLNDQNQSTSNHRMQFFETKSSFGFTVNQKNTEQSLKLLKIFQIWKWTEGLLKGLMKQ